MPTLFKNRSLIILVIFLLLIIITGFFWQKRTYLKLADLSSPLPKTNFRNYYQSGTVFFTTLKAKINNLELEAVKNYFKIELEKEILETKLEIKKLSFSFSKIWSSFFEKLLEKYEIKQKISDFLSKIILEVKNLLK